MSRADAGGTHEEPDDDEVPSPAPLRRTSVRGALRPAAVDFYDHSIRLVPANLVWGLGLISLGWLAIGVGIRPALLLSPLLAVPLVGIYRLAGHASRGEGVVLSDAAAAMRERALPAVALGAAIEWAFVLLVTNIQIGLGSGTALGWGFATVAAWALLATIVYAVVLWPLLGDPARRRVPARSTARLAALVVLAAPGRTALLTVVVCVLAAISTVAFAAILTISVAYLAIVSCRVILPEADHLVARLAARPREARR